MNEMNWDALVKEEMDWAIAQKRTLPLDDSEGFRMRVRIVGPAGQIAMTPLIWRSLAEKAQAMRMLSGCCRMVSAQAATIVSDARFLNTEAFCKHYGLAVPTPETLKAFNEERWRIMEALGGSMGALPRETWSEALMVMVYGPRIKRFVVTKYRPVDGQWLFEPMIDDSQAAKVEISMLPAWWN